MTATAKTVSAAMLAAVLTLALFLSPVGVSSAQEDSTDDTTEESTDDGTTEDGTDEESTDRPGRGDRPMLTDEEREALQAERQAERQAFLDDVASELGTTSDELVDAFKTAAINRVEAKVADGTLTQERADEIISRIEEADGLSGGFGFGGRGGHGHGHGGNRGGAAADDTAADDQEI